MWSDSGGDVEAGYEPVVFFDASPHVVVSFDLFDLTYFNKTTSASS